jgi:DNA-binding TFAR19-related protein (PDSD5 family)
MSEDSELEKLKAKRLAEMQQNISSQKQEPPAESDEQPEKKETKNPRDVVAGFLGFRGEEVLQNAENQFPLETKSIIVQLSQLIKTGELNEKMDGGQLLALFRQVGLNISLSDKISSKNNEEQ